MIKKELLQKSIVTIAKRAGLETSGMFHLTPVSRDSGGLFIMEVMRPLKGPLCNEIKLVVPGFPSDTASGCIALLPGVVDEIILAAQSARPEFISVSDRAVSARRLIGHRAGDENVTSM